MTTQTPERIRYQGKLHALCTEPLSPYLEQAGINIEPAILNSALWRGYVGTWEISDNQLYLVRIGGYTKHGKLSLSTLFPSHPRFFFSRWTKPVFADWYTGTLRIPRGEQLKFVHVGYASVHEEDVLVAMENGIVTSTEVRRNDKDDNLNPCSVSQKIIVMIFTFRPDSSQDALGKV